MRAFHLGTANGPRFCVHHEPRGQPVLGALLYLPPFAEEMNKARHMVAVAARSFAAAGFEVLLLDPLGCGDSVGEFGEATWEAWIGDALEAYSWLRPRSAGRPWLWGLRAGCLLAVDAVQRMPADAAAPSMLFWQPPASGRTLVQQFTRLRLAAGALRALPKGGFDVTDASPGHAAPHEDDRSRIGDAHEIAGYRLNPQLLAGMQRSTLAAPGRQTRAAWIEVTTRTPPQLLPGTERAAAHWRSAGHDVTALAVQGPGFWQTQEIEHAPALLAASLEVLLAAEGTRGH